MKVLLFELDADTRWILQQMLEQCELEVTAVSNPADVLTAVSHTRFDVMVLDRVASAFNAAPSLCSLVRTMQPGTPIVVTAAWRFHPDEVFPCDAILEKPFSLDRLAVTIRIVTGRPFDSAQSRG